MSSLKRVFCFLTNKNTNFTFKIAVCVDFKRKVDWRCKTTRIVMGSKISAYGEGRPDVVARLCMVVDWCIDHPEYTAKIKVIPKKDYPVLMPCEF